MRRRGIEFEEILGGRDPGFRERLLAETGRATVPQVVVGERPLGGAADLARLDRRGALLPLVGGGRFPVVRVRRRLSLRRPPWSFRVERVDRDGRVRDAVSGLSEEDAQRLSTELGGRRPGLTVPRGARSKRRKLATRQGAARIPQMSLRRPLSVAVPLLAAVVLGACGSGSSGSPGDAKGNAGSQAPSTRGLPAALAANAKQANQIIGEGTGDFQKRLKQLRGHPVVVNQWASWCPNCRAEFPFFRSAIARYRDKVAFLGLDSQDNRGDAEDFLQQIPADFPSIFDQDASVAASIGGGQSWPTTFFLDKNGQVAHVHIGAYPTEDQLTQDIQRYALGSS